MADGKNEERDELIWAAHARFRTNRSIAAEFGLTETRIGQIIKKMRAKYKPADKENVVAQTAELYAGFIRELVKVAESQPVRRVIERDEEGNEVEVELDHAGRIKAMDMAVKASAELRKMLGLDAATKVESDSTVKYVIEGVNTEDLT